MLKKVTLNNFKSFKEESIFDLEISKYKILEDRNTNNGILKGAMLVGPNASGKSNLILAIRVLLESLFYDNAKFGPTLFCLFNRNKRLNLKYEFKFGKSIVEYEFVVHIKGNVISEKLMVDKKVYLDRNGTNATIIIDGKETDYEKEVLENTLFLKKAYFASTFVKVPVIVEFMTYLENSIYVNCFETVARPYNNVGQVLDDIDESRISEINDFFKEQNIGFEIIKDSKQDVFSSISKSGKEETIVIESKKPSIFFKRKDIQLTLPLTMESLGNNTLVNIMPSFLYSCNHPGMLLIDEFSSGFHNLLEELFINYFMEHSTSSQIIFTSHSTNLLDTKILRPDQIYTITFDSQKGSVIDKFSSENPRESQNLEKMYLSGKFGAIPRYDNED